MKRWVWLGLVGLVACNTKEPPEPVEPQDCTALSESALPPDGLSSQAQELSAEESQAALDGRQPMLIRYRRTLSASSATRAAEDAVVATGGRVTTRWARLGAVAARLTPEERRRLEADPDVLSIEPDRPVRAFNRQPPVSTGSVGEYTEGLKLVQAPAVWDANNDGVLDANAPTGANIRVCVIDSGWDSRHPELAAAYVGGRDFIDDDDDPLDMDKVTDVLGKVTEQWGGGHGTHTAATIVAQLASGGVIDPAQDRNGVVGVAPGVELLVARVLNTRGNGNTSDIISAIEWCQANGARIASLSLGAPNPSAAEEEAFRKALEGGMLSIAASGNSGKADDDQGPEPEPGVAYPAAYGSVIAVGAVNFQSMHVDFSQEGPEVSLVAPGVDVLSAAIVGSGAASRVEVDGKTFTSSPLAFAPLGTYSGKLLTCGVGDSSAACGQEATCEGFVAYVDRGGVDSEGKGITFAKKVDFMRRAGARAVIIGNNDPKDERLAYTLGEEGDWVPTAAVSSVDAATLRGLGGKDVNVELFGADYVRLTGTSMAAPHVAGVAALVWSARPSLTPVEVRRLLEDSAKDLGTPGRDNKHGHGLVQAKAAMTLLGTRFPSTP